MFSSSLLLKFSIINISGSFLSQQSGINIASRISKHVMWLQHYLYLDIKKEFLKCVTVLWIMWDVHTICRFAINEADMSIFIVLEESSNNGGPIEFRVVRMQTKHVKIALSLQNMFFKYFWIECWCCLFH